MIDQKETGANTPGQARVEIQQTELIYQLTVFVQETARRQTDWLKHEKQGSEPLAFVEQAREPLRRYSPDALQSYLHRLAELGQLLTVMSVLTDPNSPLHVNQTREILAQTFEGKAQSYARRAKIEEKNGDERESEQLQRQADHHQAIAQRVRNNESAVLPEEML